MVYRIAGGIFILCLGLKMITHIDISDSIIGIVGVVAGVALLAGI